VPKHNTLDLHEPGPPEGDWMNLRWPVFTFKDGYIRGSYVAPHTHIHFAIFLHIQIPKALENGRE